MDVAPLAAAMLAEHVLLRAGLAAQRHAAADAAWQDWLDTPAFERRAIAGHTGPDEIGKWLADNVDATRRDAARDAKAYACSVECSPIGRVYLLVGQA